MVGSGLPALAADPALLGALTQLVRNAITHARLGARPLATMTGDPVAGGWRERVRGRDATRRMQEETPVPGRVWVAEGVSDYGGGGKRWFVVDLVELTDDGLIERKTRYDTAGFAAPAWCAPFVESM